MPVGIDNGRGMIPRGIRYRIIAWVIFPSTNQVHEVLAAFDRDEAEFSVMNGSRGREKECHLPQTAHFIKPLTVLRDGQETRVSSVTLSTHAPPSLTSIRSKSKYAIKRTFDRYYPIGPAWRNQARVPINAQTCKRLKSFLGEACERVRIKFKISSTSEEIAPPTSTKTPEALNVCQLQLQPMGIQSRKMMSRRRLTVLQIKYVPRKDGDEPEVGSLNGSTRLSALGIIITVLFLYDLQRLTTPAIYIHPTTLLFLVTPSMEKLDAAFALSHTSNST
ncbi:hypothetical protein D9756_010207 [Leucocoprinus leucothites]|uniref:Uncharacterized protein n=1 Tax=Leucocoprinus leucothites TaxID=201217 RepID=A0A8H5CWE3_9AGAR|nr:hypothetical protein D9756_010207 [Leucoagaricus leucothites]